MYHCSISSHTTLALQAASANHRESSFGLKHDDVPRLMIFFFLLSFFFSGSIYFIAINLLTGVFLLFKKQSKSNAMLIRVKRNEYKNSFEYRKTYTIACEKTTRKVIFFFFYFSFHILQFGGTVINNAFTSIIMLSVKNYFVQFTEGASYRRFFSRISTVFSVCICVCMHVYARACTPGVCVYVYGCVSIYNVLYA